MDSWVGKTCPYCQTPLKPGAAVVLCRACRMPHHRECWEENGRCTTYGCAGPPGDAPPGAGDRVEIVLDEPVPIICPRCRAVISPGQLFCSHCGASLAPVRAPRRRPVYRVLLGWAGAALLAGGLLVLLILYSRPLPPPHRPLPPQPFIPGAGVRVNPKDGAEMVQVPAGNFLMGSADTDKDAMDDEKPQHTVYLDAYYIYKNDVTVAQYRKFCDATGRAMPDAPDFGWQDDHPIVNVSWDDAKAYADWAGAALPTEAQWEKAARGTDGRIYPWGNDWDAQKCNCFVSGRGKTTPVGSFPAGASPCGALDMAGNVWQWCADWYDGKYYTTSPSSNPTGPTSGAGRVVRGGSWGDISRPICAAPLGTMTLPSTGTSTSGFVVLRCREDRVSPLSFIPFPLSGAPGRKPGALSDAKKRKGVGKYRDRGAIEKGGLARFCQVKWPVNERGFPCKIVPVPLFQWCPGGRGSRHPASSGQTHVIMV